MADGFGANNLKIILWMFKGIILHRAIDTFTDAHPDRN
jgi:acyl carrier protein phosphodiesterase